MLSENLVPMDRRVGTTVKSVEKVKPWSQEWLIAAGAYPGFCSMKGLGVFLLPLDGMLVHRRSLPCNLLGFPQQFSGTHLYSCLMSPARARHRIWDAP